MKKARVLTALTMVILVLFAIVTGTAQAAPVKMNMLPGGIGLCPNAVDPAAPVLGKASIDFKKPKASPGFQQGSVSVDAHGITPGVYTVELTSCEPFGGPFLGRVTWPAVAGIDGRVHAKGLIPGGVWTGLYSFQVVLRYGSGGPDSLIAAITAPTSVTVP